MIIRPTATATSSTRNESPVTSSARILDTSIAVTRWQASESPHGKPDVSTGPKDVVVVAIVVVVDEDGAVDVVVVGSSCADAGNIVPDVQVNAANISSRTRSRRRLRIRRRLVLDSNPL
jgi:hypothetical protein